VADAGAPGGGQAGRMARTYAELPGLMTLMTAALASRPHRQLSLGVPREELRRYGAPAEHAALHGLDAAGIRRSVTRFLGMA
jgi:hypothetical protein